MKLKFLLNLFNKIFDKKKKVEEKQTCKCCISDIEDRFIEVSEDKKTAVKLEKKVKPKTPKTDVKPKAENTTKAKKAPAKKAPAKKAPKAPK